MFDQCSFNPFDLSASPDLNSWLVSLWFLNNTQYLLNNMVQDEYMCGGFFLFLNHAQQIYHWITMTTKKKWNSLQRDEINRSLCPSLLSLSYWNCILTKQGEQNHYRTLKGRDTCASHPWCYSSTLTQKHIQMMNTVCAKNAIHFHYVTKTHWVTVSLQRWGEGDGRYVFILAAP